MYSSIRKTCMRVCNIYWTTSRPTSIDDSCLKTYKNILIQRHWGVRHHQFTRITPQIFCLLAAYSCRYQFFKCLGYDNMCTRNHAENVGFTIGSAGTPTLLVTVTLHNRYSAKKTLFLVSFDYKKVRFVSNTKQNTCWHYQCWQVM